MVEFTRQNALIAAEQSTGGQDEALIAACAEFDRLSRSQVERDQPPSLAALEAAILHLPVTTMEGHKARARFIAKGVVPDPGRLAADINADFYDRMIAALIRDLVSTEARS